MTQIDHPSNSFRADVWIIPYQWLPRSPWQRIRCKWRLPEPWRTTISLSIGGIILLIIILTESSSFGLLLALGIVLAAALSSLLGFGPKRQSVPSRLEVTTHHLGLIPSPHSEVLFEDVRSYRQSPAHIDVYYETISGLQHLRMLRFEFEPADWELLIEALPPRIRSQSPEARIRTALHPEG